MQNHTLSDLNAKLFNQLDRLEAINDAQALSFELNRARVLVSIAKSITDSKRLMLDVTKFADDCNTLPSSLPIAISSEL